MTDAAAERADSLAETAEELAAEHPGESYARGARILSLGIAATGVFTFAYFAVASHVLGPEAYGSVALLWSILFVVISVIYRPVEQLLSRTIADRRARGLQHSHPLRIPLAIQAGFATTFLIAALALKPQIVRPLRRLASLYWIFTGAALAYAASYFARGYFAGHQWFALYGGLVLFESVSRFCFPVAVAVGIASGQTAVALGIARRADRLADGRPLGDRAPLTAGPPRRRRRTPRRSRYGAGAGFALAVAGIQLAEQTLAQRRRPRPPTSRRGRRGRRRSSSTSLLITRAPLQLFQSIQTSLLPHLTGLEATEGHDAFARAIRMTILAIAGFAGPSRSACC